MATSTPESEILKDPSKPDKLRGTGRDADWEYLLTSPNPKAHEEVGAMSASANPEASYFDGGNQKLPEHAVAPVVRRPRLKESQTRFVLLQQWEGVVSDVGEETFVGVLRDLTAPSSARERVELDLTDVSAGDREVLERGAVFYWSIGYEYLESGQVRRVSTVRFRRTPRWSRRRLERAERRAAELMADLFGAGDR